MHETEFLVAHRNYTNKLQKDLQELRNMNEL